MPQLCTRMQNKAAMPERKTMFFGDKKPLGGCMYIYIYYMYCIYVVYVVLTSICID